MPRRVSADASRRHRTDVSRQLNRRSPSMTAVRSGQAVAAQSSSVTGVSAVKLAAFLSRSVSYGFCGRIEMARVATKQTVLHRVTMQSDRATERRQTDCRDRNLNRGRGSLRHGTQHATIALRWFLIHAMTWTVERRGESTRRYLPDGWWADDAAAHARSLGATCDSSAACSSAFLAAPAIIASPHTHVLASPRAASSAASSACGLGLSCRSIRHRATIGRCRSIRHRATIGRCRGIRHRATIGGCRPPANTAARDAHCLVVIRTPHSAGNPTIRGKSPWRRFC